MVSNKRFGRLGNELYQAAMTISYARKHNLEYSLPSETNDERWNPIHLRHLVNQNFNPNLETVLINENGHTYQEIEFREEWREKNIILNGYWQSYKYWDFCRDEVIGAFGFPYEMNAGVCSVHVRRGDYLLYPLKHPVVTEEYLREAIWYILDKAECFRFKFFSDDIEWCKGFVERGNPQNMEFEYTFSEGRSEVEDLVAMSECEFQICSNSTMSTWASELNKNPDKIVIVPSEDNWFGIDNKHLQVHDMYRKEWIQIKY